MSARRVRASPLRYPGGKGALYPLLRAVVRSNDLARGTYVEPYAGGAGAALSLLLTGEVERIVLNDLDPALYAFWRAALNESDRLIDEVLKVDLSVAEWQRQRDHYMTCDRSDYFTLGFATFYLNRTNHSGVLNGGPIGGLDQSGTYKIDARFNRAELAERLRRISVYASNVVILRWDGVKVIRRYARNPDCLIYADPPYFEKSGTLYLNSFTRADHVELAECLNDLSACRWVLTYDDVPEIRELYTARRSGNVDLYYSAHRVTRAHEFIVVSDGLTASSGFMDEVHSGFGTSV